MNKPTLGNVFLNHIEYADEDECEACEYFYHLPANTNSLPENCYPAESDCTCENAKDCPAAERKLADFMSDYLEEQESLNHA